MRRQNNFGTKNCDAGVTQNLLTLAKLTSTRIDSKQLVCLQCSPDNPAYRLVRLFSITYRQSRDCLTGCLTLSGRKVSVPVPHVLPTRVFSPKATITSSYFGDKTRLEELRECGDLIFLSFSLPPASIY
jgi:hypothetical protein